MPRNLWDRFMPRNRDAEGRMLQAEYDASRRELHRAIFDRRASNKEVYELQDRIAECRARLKEFARETYSNDLTGGEAA